jgi:hypothetical protein
MKKFLSVFTVSALVVAVFLGCSGVSGGGKGGSQTAFPEDGYNLTPFVTAPVAEVESSTASQSTSEYYTVDSIVWYQDGTEVETEQGDTEQGETEFVEPVFVGPFGHDTVYKAKLSLSAKEGYSFDGIEANRFFYTGATSVTYDAGLVTIVFPPTEPVLGQVAIPTRSPNLMINFNVAGTDSVAVTKTFKIVSDFVQSAKTKEAISERIYLGDYIDLPSLTVAAYEGNGAISVTNTDWGDERGAKLRIIVVGINSFSTVYSTNASYAVSENNNVPHVVFQFQNLPGEQKINTTSINAGGYVASMMRKYLMPIEGGSSGSFYNGLIAAGVPADVLWGPKRSMAKNYNDAAGASCNIIQDVLWLPTELEMFGIQDDSSRSETAANQARLEYYDSDAKRIKYDMSGKADHWWVASPYYDSAYYISLVAWTGWSTQTTAANGNGVAPAFCVK